MTDYKTYSLAGSPTQTSLYILSRGQHIREHNKSTDETHTLGYINPIKLQRS